MKIRKLVTHDNCADGLASALVTRFFHPSVKVEFVQYGTPRHRNLPVEDGLVFCDMSPPRARAPEFVEAGAYCLDHHASVRDIVESFGDRGIFGDEVTEPGVSGAVLAYRHLGGWDNRDVGRFAHLVGLRDTWQTEHELWSEALDLHALLMGLPRDWWLESALHEAGVIVVWALNYAEDLGRALRVRRDQEVVDIAASSLCSLVDETGCGWAVFPDPSDYVSDVAERARDRGFSCCCGFYHKVAGGERSIVYSMRSDGSVDVGALARALGGGGHTRAAGFSVGQRSTLWRHCGWDPWEVFRCALIEARGT